MAAILALALSIVNPRRRLVMPLAHVLYQPNPPCGAFRNGATGGTDYADFDQSYDPINGLNYETTSSRYTVEAGDTLDSIALKLWGDASFWYMIADANGLSGSEALVAGMNLVIPNKVHNSHNSSDTYRVYDPNEATGNSRSGPRPPLCHQIPDGKCTPPYQ